jgi:hypothetical protein
LTAAQEAALVALVTGVGEAANRRPTLAVLHRRGLVTHPDPDWGVLTAAGREVAEALVRGVPDDWAWVSASAQRCPACAVAVYVVGRRTVAPGCVAYRLGCRHVVVGYRVVARFPRPGE